MQPTQTTDAQQIKLAFKYWQTSTIVGLFTGYSGYYICRSNLSVATPLIISEFSGQGINKEVMGQIASMGVYCCFWHGNRPDDFFSAWAINRLVQSMGWGGLVKTTANWAAYQSYGRIMALLSLSFLFGDIVAKLLLGQLIKMDIGWRKLFFVAAALLAVIACFSFFW